MKILISNIFLRKSFDVINILLKYYSSDHLIFTLPSDNRFNRFRLKAIYDTYKYELLTHDSFDKNLAQISKNYQNEKIIYIPIEESTTYHFLNHIERNGSMNFYYLLPDVSNFNLSRDKEKLNLFCEKTSIFSPKYISETDLKHKNFQYPIIKKPKNGSGAKGIVYIENEDDLINCRVDFNTDFIQERLPNPHEVQAGFYLCEQGQIVTFYSHRRIRTYPNIGGVTIYSKCEYNNEIKNLGAKVLKELNWSGFIMIEFLFDHRDGLYKLIEINPRLWGSIMLSEFCGAKFLQSYIRCSLSEESQDSQINTEKYIRWIFPYDIMYWINNISNPFLFFKKEPNTCYINFTYSTSWKSLKFIFLTYFDLYKLQSLFK